MTNSFSSSALASTSSRWSPSNYWTTGRTRRDRRRRRRRRRRNDDDNDDGVVRSFPPLRARKTRYEYEREEDDDELRKDEDLELLRDLVMEDNTEEEEEEDDEEEDETLGTTTRRRRRTKSDINAGAGGDDFETLITPRAKYRARIDASPTPRGKQFPTRVCLARSHQTCERLCGVFRAAAACSRIVSRATAETR